MLFPSLTLAKTSEDLSYFTEVEGGYKITDENMKKLNNLYNSLNEKINKLQEAIKEEREKADDVIMTKNNKIENLEAQLTELKKVRADLRRIIDNKDEIITMEREKVKLLNRKLEVKDEILQEQKAITGLKEEQKIIYKEMYEAEQKISMKENINFAVYGTLIGLIIGIYATN